MAGTGWALHASNWAAFNLFTAPTIVQYIQRLQKPNGAKGIHPNMGKYAEGNRYDPSLALSSQYHKIAVLYQKSCKRNIKMCIYYAKSKN